MIPLGALGIAAALALAPAAPGAGGEPVTSAARAEHLLRERPVPDIPLQLADGRTAQISTLWRDRPLLVTFFYQRCTGVCMPLLEWVRDATREVGGLGADYRVLALSFDDSDTVAGLRAQAAALGLEGDPGWIFAVAEREAVARIAGALDFWYRLDPATQQFDHPVLLVAVEHGRVVRALLESAPRSQRLRELAWELRGRFIPLYRTAASEPLRCLAFDPRSGQVRLDWGMLLLAAPAFGALTLTLGVFGGAALARPRRKPSSLLRRAIPGTASSRKPKRH